MEGTSLQRGKKEPAQNASSNRTLMGNGEKTKVCPARTPVLDIGCDMRVRQNRHRSSWAGRRIPKCLVKQIPENRLICSVNLANRVGYEVHLSTGPPGLADSDHEA